MVKSGNTKKYQIYHEMPTMAECGRGGRTWQTHQNLADVHGAGGAGGDHSAARFQPQAGWGAQCE